MSIVYGSPDLKTSQLLLIVILFIGCEQSQQRQAVAPTRQKTTAATIEPPDTREIAADKITGKVIKIIDGDTLDILTDDKETIRIRLEGIDTPERGQAFGTKAKEKLAELTFGKVVSVRSIGQDRYGRELGRITADGIDVNLELVRAGMAWHYKQYSKEQVLADAEMEARKDKVGLWADAKPVAPWDWRKLPKEERKD